MAHTKSASKPKKLLKKKKGRLIVIEGADGSGKATQAELLVAYLRKSGKRVLYYDFPQYQKTFFGDMVARFMRGEFGTLKQVSPYLASLPYALDRACVAQEMEEFLGEGGWIVCNRYVSSHLAHQTAKIASPAERKVFIEWVQRLEYRELGVVPEDMVICLQVPYRIASGLTLKKGTRAHLKTMKKDIAERDSKHQKTAAEMYVALAKKLKHWKLVKCVDKKGDLLPIETIHELIVQSVLP